MTAPASIDDERKTLQALRDAMEKEGQRLDRAIVKLAKGMSVMTELLEDMPDGEAVARVKSAQSRCADAVCDVLQAGQHMRSHVSTHFIFLEFKEGF
ncbi:MAG TPA: hypothetical protein VGU72_04465 [Beijerinckiaceae bacterium]|jgi:septal ring factor EnvC (AmiA/AmiB activator)|nr:hypothetical protein [Beijerinckiaceae bacterium]